MLAEMCVFGVQIYPSKNKPMVILVKSPNNPTPGSKNYDKRNALSVSTGIMEILTLAFLINPDNKNSSLVKNFTGSFHEFVGENVTKIEINADGDGVGIIHSTHNEEKQKLKIRASDAICLSLVLNVPIYTRRKYLKHLDEIYK